MIDQNAPEWVSDGKHIYPYNEHLYDMLQKGELKVCDAPQARVEPPELVALRELALSKGYTLPNRCTVIEAQQLYNAFVKEKERQEAVATADTAPKPTKRRKVQAEVAAPQPAGAEVAGFPA